MYKTSIVTGPDMRHGPGPELMGAETLIGSDVYNKKGEDLGDIKEIMLDMRTGRVAYAVLSFGGFLGMGGKLFAVPWTALVLDTENKRFALDVDKIASRAPRASTRTSGPTWRTQSGPKDPRLLRHEAV